MSVLLIILGNHNNKLESEHLLHSNKGVGPEKIYIHARQ